MKLFSNRRHAAALLAARLSMDKSANSIVVAIPRGGVCMGDVVARALMCPLEIALTKKIGHPSNPEYSIASVGLSALVLNEAECASVSKEYLDIQTAKQRALLRKRYSRYIGNRGALSLRGRDVIIVDDGIATGNTIQAAVSIVTSESPLSITVAVPVATRRIVHNLRKHGSKVICLYQPLDFFAVGEFYEDFTQTSDEEVVQILGEFERDFPQFYSRQASHNEAEGGHINHELR